MDLLPSGDSWSVEQNSNGLLIMPLHPGLRHRHISGCYCTAKWHILFPASSMAFYGPFHYNGRCCHGSTWPGAISNAVRTVRVTAKAFEPVTSEFTSCEWAEIATTKKPKTKPLLLAVRFLITLCFFPSVRLFFCLRAQTFPDISLIKRLNLVAYLPLPIKSFDTLQDASIWWSTFLTLSFFFSNKSIASP